MKPSMLLLWFGLVGTLAGPHAAEKRASIIQEDFPFQIACVGLKSPKDNTALKGIAIRLGTNAAICFDTDTLRVAGGWTGGFITTSGVTFDGSHGRFPAIAGDQKFATAPGPGWAGPGDSLMDPRAEPFGPLPASWGRWSGLYLDGDAVVLSYTVGNTKILERWSASIHEGQTAFVRTFQIAGPRDELTVRLFDAEGSFSTPGRDIAQVVGADGLTTVVTLRSQPSAATFARAGTAVLLKIPGEARPTAFSVIIFQATAAVAKTFSQAPAIPNLVIPAKNPLRWPEIIHTRGILGSSATPDGAYVTDQLTPPVDNPWKRRVRFAGLDFFADGQRAALSTWDGDVWIVSGIDRDLTKLSWKRFASGLYEPLGLKIVNDIIYTSGRDQITRLHDLNKDGEADFYENFHNEITSSTGFHEFVFDLHTDAAGNFYTIKAGPVRGGGQGFGGGGGNGTITRDAGTLLKISADGSRRWTYATGFRAPNGIGVGPHGQVTSGDNEGTWVPACPINWIREGGFYGVEDLAHRAPVPMPDKPLCWLSKSYDNSGGSQVWVTSDKWGPYQGELLHLSYGRCRLYQVLRQEIGGDVQGGVVQIPVRFSSSAMRARFNPRDGQLYVAGLQGWQTDAARITGLDRVRYTGQPVYAAVGLRVDSKGLHITFSQPLDPPSATDSENYSAEQWNYRRSGNYGSPEISVAEPEKHKRDLVTISQTKLSEDGKTVTLEIPGLKPVMQMYLKYNIKSRDGKALKQEIMHTIHNVPPP